MEAKELLEYMGIEATDMDDFKSKFPEKYVSDPKTAAHKFLKPIMGEKLGKVKQNLLNKAREEGIEFKLDEFDNLEVEAVHELLSEKRALKLKSELEELKKKAGENGDEKVKDLQERFEKAQKRAADEEKLRKELAGEFDTYKAESANKYKSLNIATAKEKILSKVQAKFKPGMSDLEREGFHSKLEKSLKFDFDDKGDFIPLDSNGSRIRSTKKADEFLGAEDAVFEFAKAAGVLAENPQAGKPVNRVVEPPKTFTPSHTPDPNQKRKVHPSQEKYL